MSKGATLIQQQELADHAAVKAWAQLSSERIIPKRIHTLKKLNKSKSAVYRLEGVGPFSSPVIAKWCTLACGLVEHTIYGEILPQLPLPALPYYGFVQEAESCWLFLGDAGEGAYLKSLPAHRALASRWLGIMHVAAADLPAISTLPERGPGFYLQHLTSSRTILLNYIDEQHGVHTPLICTLHRILIQLDRVESHWRQVDSWCRTVPSTLVHGDFVKKNVRIGAYDGSLSVFALDWEMAGRGTAAPDLQSLDLDIYHSAVQDSWPQFDVSELEEWRRYGLLLRWVAAIDWEAMSLRGAWVERSLSYMEACERGLTEALRNLGWK